ncbi:Iq motif and sec7 domain-containing protein 1, partial [Plakobranchus ocellatus]
VEMLERKYGGSIRSRRAARTIQRAYRQYCMTRNFQKLRHSCTERRLSKRLSELGRSNSVWGDRLSSDFTAASNTGSLDSIIGYNRGVNDVEDGNNNSARGGIEDGGGGGGEEDGLGAFNRNIRNMVADLETTTSNNNQLIRQQQQQMGFSFDSGSLERDPGTRRSSSGPPPPQRVDSKRRSDQQQPPAFQQKGLSRNAFSTPGFAQDAGGNYTRGPAQQASTQRVKGNGMTSTYSNGSDLMTRGVAPYADSAPNTSAGDFVRAAPLDAAGTPVGGIDPHSMDFETLLESKETDILTDSFHSSEGGHDIVAPPAGSQHHAHFQHHGVSATNRPSISSIGSTGSDGGGSGGGARTSFDSFRTISIDPSDYLPSEAELAGLGDQGEHPASPSSPGYKEQMNAAQMRYYMANSQAKYRSPQQQLQQHQQQQLQSTPKVAVVAPSARSTDTSPVWKRKGDGPALMGVPTSTPASLSNTPGAAVTASSMPSANNALSNASSTSSLDTKKRMSNISETSELESLDETSGLTANSSSENDATSSENINSLGGSNSTLSVGLGTSGGLGGSDGSLSYQRKLRMSMTNSEGSPASQTVPRVNDKKRRRLYRIGLNLFNKKPEKGLNFLLDNMFLDSSPRTVAKFFITRKGLSKQMIGEFLGNLLNPFNQEVLQYFCEEIDLSGLQVDLALRKFQCHFRMPGEAQKIERLMEAFADRYCECNPDQVKNFKSSDTVFLLAFAIIMLNTDLHNPSVKAERKMKLEDFIKNLRGIDDGEDIDRDLLSGIYERVKGQEFKAGTDQVTQVMKVEQTIIGKKPILAVSHRRLVCYCRLYEVHDINKKEKVGLHQREVFLFNDLLLVTKIFSKKKTSITYSFRNSLSLCGMQVYLFENSHYLYGIQLTNNIDGKPLMTFNARNDHDRKKFVDDLKESILETNGMEQLRIEEEMSRHRSGPHHHPNSHHHHHTLDKRYANDDSAHRVLAYDLAKPANGGGSGGGGSGGAGDGSGGSSRLSAPDYGLKKVAYSNSLSDLTTDPVMKRGSSGASLDSGMASGSLGSTSSDSHPSGTVFASAPASQLTVRSSNVPATGTSPSAGGAGGKRQSGQAGGTGQQRNSPIVLKPGLPDGTQV